ncbi:uncharacterized protein [Nicotiana sylvestris]|uniref:uncharacterized protein n=1 Tax=Nicotiana sylvestris TaxID=4096 RepID=UPI00388CC136
MAVIGPIDPTTSNGHKFILVAIDYFKKWVEAASYKAVTKKVIADFVKDCEAELSEAEWIRGRYEKLALIDGKRINAKIFPHQDEAKGKFSPNWQGPYMVHMVLTGGALILVEMDGELWPNPINSDAFKSYYA